MTPTRAEVEELVLQIQGEFLNTPALRLTLRQVALRVGIRTATCESVLRALVDAGVLALTPAGSYQRFFPRPVSGTNGSHSRAA